MHDHVPFPFRTAPFLDRETVHIADRSRAFVLGNEFDLVLFLDCCNKSRADHAATPDGGETNEHCAVSNAESAIKLIKP